MRTEQIEYRNINLLVTGDYEKGEEGDYMHPGASSEFKIYKIILEDSETDIFNLFDWDDINEIEYLTIQQIEK